jgi:hypothetical protein
MNGKRERVTMQPYIPYIVLEALVAERVRKADAREYEPVFGIGPALRRRLGEMLVRVGVRLQGSVPAPAASAA